MILRQSPIVCDTGIKGDKEGPSWGGGGRRRRGQGEKMHPEMAVQDMGAHRDADNEKSY